MCAAGNTKYITVSILQFIKENTYKYYVHENFINYEEWGLIKVFGVGFM